MYLTPGKGQTIDSIKSMHPQLSNIHSFMSCFGQTIRTSPAKNTFGVTYEERLLRARLILEEALEQVNSLGFSLCDIEDEGHMHDSDRRNEIKREDFEHENCPHDDFPLVLVFRDNLAVHLSTILDGIVDQDYVSKGTLFTFGLQDLLEPAENLVHESNMSKLWTLKQLESISTELQNRDLSAMLTPCGRYVVRCHDGKVQKPPTFKAPNLKGLVEDFIAAHTTPTPKPNA